MTYKNNFGALRLIFASLVIFSHSPELIDGNRNHEVLTQIFGTISLGELAVSGFFLISGYLIIKSYENSPSVMFFLTKRALRILPGFIAASAFCIFIVAPLSGGIQVINNLLVSDWLKLLFGLAILDIPRIDGVFSSNAVQSINGSMWTIWLEFLCYLSIPIFAYLGLYKKKLFIITGLMVASIFLFLSIYEKDVWIPYPFRISAVASSRLLLAFMIGSAFHLFRDKIQWSLALSTVAFVCLIACLFYKPLSFAGLYVFGGYLLFNFALNFKNVFLNHIGQKNDISYGVYLYAWPAQSLIIQYYPNMHHFYVSLITLCIAATLGYFSWVHIEKPFAKIKVHLQKAAATQVHADATLTLSRHNK